MPSPPELTIFAISNQVIYSAVDYGRSRGTNWQTTGDAGIRRQLLKVARNAAAF